MIIKTIPLSARRADFRRVLFYIDKGVAKKENSSGMFPICHNTYSTTPKDVSVEFKEHDKYRPARKRSVWLYHEIISFEPTYANFLSEERLFEIAQAYIQKRSDQPSMCYCDLHWPPGGNPHLHFAFHSRALDGSSLRLPKKEFISLRKKMELERNRIVPEIERKIYLKDNGRKDPNREHSQIQEQQLEQQIMYCQTKANSIQHFFELLADQNIETYKYRGKTKGILFEGKKYRFSRLGVDLKQFSTERERQMEPDLTQHFDDLL